MLHFVRQSSRVECEDKKTGVSYAGRRGKRSDPADVRDSVTSGQSPPENLLLRHVSAVSGAKTVPLRWCCGCVMKCDGDLFVTKGCCT